jgi:hypothetical protein
MKNVFIKKDAYIDNSVRVNYFTEIGPEEELELVPFALPGEVLIYCERLFWNENESELDTKIEAKRLKYEERINK